MCGCHFLALGSVDVAVLSLCGLSEKNALDVSWWDVVACVRLCGAGELLRFNGSA